jgi:hypothetical protein
MAPACRVICTCSPCSDADFDACLDQAEKAQDHAADAECTPVFDTFVDCFEAKATCHGPTASPIDGCTRAESKLRTCADAGNPFASVCEDAEVKTAACVPGKVPQPVSTCPEQAACSAACIVAASCDAISGAVFDKTFSDCLNGCAGITPGGPPPD